MARVDDPWLWLVVVVVLKAAQRTAAGGLERLRLNASASRWPGFFCVGRGPMILRRPRESDTVRTTRSL